jgi:hypothetical protein
LYDRDQVIFRAPKLRWRIADVIAGRNKSKKAEADDFIPPTAIAYRFVKTYMSSTGLVKSIGWNACYAIASQLVYSAAGQLLGLMNLRETNRTVADHHVQIVDALLDPTNQGLILRVALRMLIQQRPDLVPGLAATFQDIITELETDKEFSFFVPNPNGTEATEPTE